MNARQASTLVQTPDLAAVPGLAKLAFGSGVEAAPGGAKHLAFLPPEALELDLADPDQRDFGDYELVEQIGQGGMGVVYRAHQRSLDREVALKLLSAGPWASPEFIARFQREARSAARLQHPNIIAIHEIGCHADLSFFSMALVRGDSLAQRLERGGALPPLEAARLVRTIAEALDYAHRLGILHLDLKPANVLIDEHGEPQVADFGLARRLDEALSQDSTEVSGTPSYMAPEQAQMQGPRLSAATDIYGLGAILYELLTGQPPFLGSSAGDTLMRVLTEEVQPPRRVNRLLPADLDAICLRCLAKDPAHRYVTARGLAEDLGRFIEGRAVSVRPLTLPQRIARWARREPRVAGSVALALLAVLLGLVGTSLQWQRAEQQSQLAQQAADAVRATLWRKRSDDAALLIRERRGLDSLPDLVQNLVEQEAVGALDEAGRSRIRIGSVLSDAPALIDQVAVGDRIMQVLADPAGHWVVASTSVANLVQRLDLPGGERRWQVEATDGNRSARLLRSSDGRHLIAEVYNLSVPMPRGLGAYLIDLDTGARRDPPADRFPDPYANHFSADAAWAMVITRDHQDGGSPRGRLVRVADWQVVGEERALDGLVLLGPEGEWLALHSPARGGQPTPVEILDARSFERRWQHQPELGAALAGWRIAPRGAQIALGFEDGRVGLFEARTGAPHWLPSRASARIDDLYFSAGGEWLAATHVDGSVQVWDTADGSPQTLPLRLSADQENVLGEIVLDPALRRIYSGERDGARLWHLAGGDRPAELLFQRPRYPRPINNLANTALIGQGLFFAGANDGALRVWRQRPRAALPALAPLRQMREGQRRTQGARLLHVDGASAQIVDTEGRAGGEPFEFPQALGFAELAADGRLLVASAGAELHVRGIDGDARYPPLALPATPSAVLVPDDGRRAVVAWQVHEDGRSGLAVRSIDLADGRTLAQVQLDHPATNLQLGDDGESLLAWRLGPLEVRDVATLRTRFTRDFSQEDSYTPVRGARIGRDGATLWVASGIGGGDGYRMHALDARDGRELQVWRMPSWALALQPFEGGKALAALLSTENELRVYRLGSPARSMKLAHLDAWGYPDLAMSADESRLVIGLGRGVQWLDLQRLEWLSPPLQLPTLDAQFAALSLDAAGGSALMQDKERRQWRFDLVHDARPGAELQALARLLAPADRDLPEALAIALDASTRATLRAADPGPPDPAPLPGASANPRPDPGPLVVDLRAHCNLEFASAHTTLHGGLHLDRVLAPGRQRLLGIDFETRCGIAPAYAPQAAASVALGSRVEGIALPQEHAAALELLLLASTRMRDDTPSDYAVLEFGYRDGGRERVPIVYGRDLEAWFNPDYHDRLRSLRVAHVALGARFSQGGAASTVPPALYAVRVANPHPQRALASLAFESTRYPWSRPVLLAATVEAPAAAVADAARGTP